MSRTVSRPAAVIALGRAEDDPLVSATASPLIATGGAASIRTLFNPHRTVEHLSASEIRRFPAK